MSDCSFTQRIECHHALMETTLTLTELTWWRGWFNYWYRKMNQKCSVGCRWGWLILEGPTSHPLPHPPPKTPQTKQLQKAKKTRKGQQLFKTKLKYKKWLIYVCCFVDQRQALGMTALKTRILMSHRLIPNSWKSWKKFRWIFWFMFV